MRVEVHLKNQKKLERAQEAPRGSDEQFATAAEIVGKFEKLAARALPAGRVTELRDAVLGLEELSEAAQIAALLSA